MSKRRSGRIMSQPPQEQKPENKYILGIKLEVGCAGDVITQDDFGSWEINGFTYDHRGSIQEGEIALLLDYMKAHLPTLLKPYTPQVSEDPEWVPIHDDDTYSRAGYKPSRDNTEPEKTRMAEGNTVEKDSINNEVGMSQQIDLSGLRASAEPFWKPKPPIAESELTRVIESEIKNYITPGIYELPEVKQAIAKSVRSILEALTNEKE